MTESLLSVFNDYIDDNSSHFLGSGVLIGICISVISSARHHSVRFLRHGDVAKLPGLAAVELLVGLGFTSACVIAQALAMIHFNNQVLITRITVASVIFVLGHFVSRWGPIVNPSVALAECLCGVRSVVLTGVAVVCQIIAGVVSLILVNAILPAYQTKWISQSSLELGPGVDVTAEFWPEVLLSTLNYFACTGYPVLALHQGWPLWSASATVSLIIVCACVVAGGGMNFAMTISFSLLNGQWAFNRHILYTGAPVIGAVLAGTLSLLVLETYSIKGVSTTPKKKGTAKKKVSAPHASTPENMALSEPVVSRNRAGKVIKRTARFRSRSPSVSSRSRGRSPARTPVRKTRKATVSKSPASRSRSKSSSKARAGGGKAKSGTSPRVTRSRARRKHD